MIQRVCGSLPFGNEAVYYALQRRFGSLKQPVPPDNMLSECARIVRRLRDAGYPMEGKRVMEVGPGRRLFMPIGYYLSGASSVVAVDLHPYLKAELVMDSIQAMRQNRVQYREYFLGLTDEAGLDQRFEALLAARDLKQLLAVTRIEYLAPGDARNTGFPAESVDIHTSYTVFEHIPRDVLVAILREASRILKPGGVAFHQIDPADHFAYEDSSISLVNFLQFSDQEWEHLAGNQFAYHNRLRADELREVYEEAGHRIIQWEPKVDPRALLALKAGQRLDPRFRGKSAEDLCTIVLQVMSR